MSSPKKLCVDSAESPTPSGEQKKTALSLKDICIDFVAININIVESLVGFPDIVGHEIFEAVVRIGHLEDWRSDLTASTLQLFSDSYEDQVLEELNLSVFPGPLLEECCGLVAMFCNLHQLDLSNRRLGDDHKLWQWLGNLNMLTGLSLKNNCLTDRGLKMLTLPTRMYGRGPVSLRLLDISCNPKLSDECLRYIQGFRNLKDLDLSGCRITKTGISRIERTTTLRRVPAGGDELVCKSSLCGDKGWAANVVAGWSDKYLAIQASSQHPHSDGSVLAPRKFYEKKKSLHELESCTPCPQYHPVICFRTPGGSSSHYPDSLVNHDTVPLRDISGSANRFSNGRRQKKQGTSSLEQVIDLCTNSTNTPDDNEGQSHQSERSERTAMHMDYPTHQSAFVHGPKSKHPQFTRSDQNIKSDCTDPDLSVTEHSELLSGYWTTAASTSTKNSSLWSAMNSGAW